MGRQGTRQYDETAGGVRSIRRRRGLPGGLAGAAALALLAGLGLQAPMPAYAVTGGGAQFDTWATWASNTGGFAAPQGTHWGAPAETPDSYAESADWAVAATDGSLREWSGSFSLVTATGTVSSDPAIMHASGYTNIAAVAPDGNLRLWWAPTRTSSWKSETVGGPVAAYTRPAITDSGNAVHIAAAGQDGSLWFFWAWNGTSTWHADQIAGPGAVASYDAPTMTEYGGMTQIAATTRDGGLDFWWIPYYTTTWHYEQITGPLAVTSAPTMVIAGDGTAEIAVSGPGSSLLRYWAAFGSATWNLDQVDGPGTSQTTPAIGDDGNGVYIVATSAVYTAAGHNMTNYNIYSGGHNLYTGTNSPFQLVFSHARVAPCYPTAPAMGLGISNSPWVVTDYSC